MDENLKLEPIEMPDEEPIIELEPSARKLRTEKLPVIFSGLAFLILAIGYFGFIAAPFGFPVGKIVKINRGLSTSEIGVKLAEAGVIRSATVFKYLAYLYPGRSGVIATDYAFNSRLDLFGVVRRLKNGFTDIGTYKITIPEGLDNEDLAKLLSQKLQNFDAKEFLAKAASLEGQLFPDTYSFLASVSVDEIINKMNDTYKSKVRGLLPDIQNGKRTEGEILVMASLIEKEANTKESRRIISGILWNRLEKGMRLQVDAVFPYIMDKYSLQLTKKDLTFDSPYNTYKYAGLPPSPIANPSFDSIQAAVYPADTQYVYYLSDKAGNLYYAKTLEEHNANKKKYL